MLKRYVLSEIFFPIDCVDMGRCLHRSTFLSEIILPFSYNFNAFGFSLLIKIVFCLPILSEISDKMGKQCMAISFSDIAIRLLGVSPVGSACASEFLRHPEVATGDPYPKPRTGRFCVQSNTPDGVAFPLPAVAPSCTSAQEGKHPIRAFSHTV